MLATKQTQDIVTIRTFCHACNHDINITIPTAIVEEATKFPVNHAHLHGQPAHVLIVYIDRQYLVRGTELSETVTMERTRKTNPLNAMVLLQIPPRYKQTAMAMLKLHQASPTEVAKLTGKTPNAESQYLGAMFRLGYLERTRIRQYYQYRIASSAP